MLGASLQRLNFVYRAGDHQNGNGDLSEIQFSQWPETYNYYR